MKKGLIIPFLLVSMVLLTACKKDRLEYAANYGLSLRVKAEGEFTQVKSASEKVDVNTFKIAIKNNQDIVAKSWEKFSEMPSVVTLEPGNYTIEACSPGNLPVAFDQPIYAGAQPFEVKAGQISVIDLTCSLSNMKVTVIPTEKFYKELNDDFTIIVTSTLGHLVFNKEVTQAGRSGYFKVTPTFDVHIQGTRRANGEHVNHFLTIKNCAAKDHHVLKIDAQETGDISFGESGIIVDYTVNNREENIYIGGWDEPDIDDNPNVDPDPNPNQPDPDTPDPDQPEPQVPAITIEAPGISEMLVLTDAQAEGAQVDVKITAENGIKELWVDIQSEYLEGMLVGMGLPKKFNMADLSDPATKEFITGLGLLAAGQVSGAKSYSFSIGGFMLFIESTAPNPVHTFEITVIDAKDNTKTEKIVIKRIA